MTHYYSFNSGFKNNPQEVARVAKSPETEHLDRAVFHLQRVIQKNVQPSQETVQEADTAPGSRQEESVE